MIALALAMTFELCRLHDAERHGVPFNHCPATRCREGRAIIERLRSEMESILQEAERLTNRDRNQAYGHPLDDYTRTVGMFNAAFAHKLKEPLTPQEMMLAMVLVKVSRELHKPGRDNRVDICGYTNCIQMAYERQEFEAKPKEEENP